MAEDKPQQEPSMEEILASIRKIISEEVDEDSDEKADEGSDATSEDEDESAADDVLELTQVVQDDGSTIDIKEEPPEAEAEPEPEPETEPDPEPEPETEPEPEMEIEAESPGESDERLISEDTAETSADAFANLAKALEPSPLPSTGVRFGDSARTIEDLMMELLRPMLKEWLDKNLPTYVERLVQREIRHVVRRSEPD